MLNHVRRDLIFSRSLILIYLAYVTLYWVWLGVFAEISPRVALLFFCLMLGLLPFNLQAQEDKLRTAAFTCSLPTTRRQVVLARHLSAWSLMLALLGYGLAVGTLFPRGRALLPGMIS